MEKCLITMREYFKYLLGGSKFWIGRPLKDSHAHLGITEEHFDKFYSFFSKQLKTMKVNIRIVSAILKKVNELREEVIKYDHVEDLKGESGIRDIVG